jgi:hypothetical protein
MRWLFAILLGLGPHGLLSAQPVCYDFNTLRLSAQAEILQPGCGSYVLHCLGCLEDGEGETQSFHLRGLASPIVVGGKTYFLGAGHVFDLQSQLPLRGVSLAGVTVRSCEYSLEFQGRGCALRRVDRGGRDLALFVAQDPADFPRARYACGDSDDLHLGNPVLSWGMPLMEDFELSMGIVSALAAPPSLLAAIFPEAAAQDFFVASLPSIFGCSGALVYAFRAGEPEIVGMLVAGYLNLNRSIVYKINAILRDCGFDP